jgi:hypothetical protein
VEPQGGRAGGTRLLPLLLLIRLRSTCLSLLTAPPQVIMEQDFEILMSGCVVIKPRTDIFRLHPPIFEVRRRSWSAAAALGPHGAGTRWLPRAGCQGRALPSCPPFPAACLP